MNNIILGCIFVWGLAVLIFTFTICSMVLRNRNNFNLTKEDLDFLIDLQHEMLTQDTVCQAAPRFWTVAGTRREYRGEEYSVDGEILISDTEEIANGLEDAVEYFLDEYFDKLNDFNIRIEEDTFGYKVTQFDPGTHIEGDIDDTLFETHCISSIKELIEALEDVGLIKEEVYTSACYSNEHYVYPNTMFLTNRSCKEHIKSNHYHYSADAHSYAMTAWRSPEVEKLWNILDKIDWETMRNIAYKPNKEETK
jgi:hypothetical protein